VLFAPSGAVGAPVMLPGVCDYTLMAFSAA
jgi:hypothetical protein